MVIGKGASPAVVRGGGLGHGGWDYGGWDYSGWDATAALLMRSLTAMTTSAQEDGLVGGLVGGLPYPQLFEVDHIRQVAQHEVDVGV